MMPDGLTPSRARDKKRSGASGRKFLDSCSKKQVITGAEQEQFAARREGKVLGRQYMLLLCSESRAHALPSLARIARRQLRADCVEKVGRWVITAVGPK
jgi:hypothetical protein